MGEADFYRTKYGLMPTLGGSRRRAPQQQGGDEGDLFDLEEQANNMGRQQREGMGEYGEILAPDLAAKEGISLEEARQRLTGGTRGPEGPLHFVGRNVSKLWGAGAEPQGEEQGVRLSRLKGMIERRQLEAHDRTEAMGRAKELYGMRGGVEDPGSLGEPTLESLRGGGVTGLPDHMRLKGADATSLVGLYQRDPNAARELANIIYGGKNAGGGKLSAGVAMAQALADARRRGDKVAEQSILDVGGKGGNPRPSTAEVEFEKFVGDRDTQAALADEADAEQQAHKIGQTPAPGPYTRRYNQLKAAAEQGRAGNTRDSLYGRPDDNGGDDDPSGDQFLDSVLGPVEGEPTVAGRRR